MESEWLDGLNYIRENSQESYIYTLFSVYLDEKFEAIRGSIAETLVETIPNYDIDMGLVLGYVEDGKQSVLLSQLIDQLPKEQIYRYANALYLGEYSLRSQLVEDLGRYVLDYNNVLDLYSLEDKNIKSGVLASSGFITEDAIYDWLVDELYNDDEELSSAAVFSLSKHGSRGFSYLAKNLIYLSNRLKLISIDLLTFNKVEEAYGYYSILLEEPNDLLDERVLNSYREMGSKGVDYIIDALLISHQGVKADLLEILETIPGADYLSRITFLLSYTDLQEYIIDLYFKHEAVGILEDLLLRGDFSVEGKVMEYSVKNRSDLLIRDKSLEYYTLNYLIENYDQGEINQFFTDLGFEKNYIEDYNFIVDIYRELNIADSFEQFNGEVDYVTTYFEIEQKISIESQEERLFYQNMESWLETGDYRYLNNSISLKQSSDSDDSNAHNEKKSYLDQIPEEELLTILEYEEALKNIVINYRKLTYRLKNYGRTMISKRGYFYLIR